MDERSPDSDPHTPGLTDSEQRLLDHIRAGLVDAEIAVRLGISNAEVKSRTARLATKLRVDGREGLKNPTQEPAILASSQRQEMPGRREGFPLVSGLAALIVIAAGVVAVAWWAGGSQHDDTRASADAAGPTPEPAATSTPPSTRPPPQLTVIDGREMYDLGLLFTSDDGDPVENVELREAAVVVSLRPGAEVAMVSPVITWVVFGSGPGVLQASAAIDGRIGWHLTILSADDHTTFAANLPGGPERPASIAVSSSAAGATAVVLITATLRSEAARADRGHRHHVTVNAAGNLFVSEHTLDLGDVIDERTGERVAIPADAVTLNGFAVDESYNFCDPRGCTANVQFRSLRSPLAAEYGCDADGVIRLATAEYVLRLERAPGQAPTGCHFDSGTRVAAGDYLGVPGSYSLTAAAVDGTFLSVAVTQGGALVIGNLSGSGLCPCLVGR